MKLHFPGGGNISLSKYNTYVSLTSYFAAFCMVYKRYDVLLHGQISLYLRNGSAC